MLISFPFLGRRFEPLKTFVSLLSLEQHMYYITSKTICQVLFQKNLKLFFRGILAVVSSDLLNNGTYLVATLAGLRGELDDRYILGAGKLVQQGSAAFLALFLRELVRLGEDNDERDPAVDQEVHHHHVVGGRRVPEVYQLEHQRKLAVVVEVPLDEPRPALLV